MSKIKNLRLEVRFRELSIFIIKFGLIVKYLGRVVRYGATNKMCILSCFERGV